MWDLEQIILNNNQAAVDFMMRGQKIAVAESPQPREWTLARLAEKLKIGPPLLSELMDICTDFKTIEDFLGLIRTFLPEHEKEILAERRTQRVYRFAYLFGERYFPLPTFTHERSLEEFVGALPVELMGMSPSVYHNLEMRPGYILLLSLVVFPYVGDERYIEEEETDADDPIGARVPLLDMVQRIVGESLAQSIPRAGWTPARLHQMTDKTLYEGAGDFADWACSETGCVVLDSNYGDCDYQEGYGEPVFQWTKRNVEILTGQWPKVKKIRETIDHIVEWLEADPTNNFGQLLKYLLSQDIPKEKIQHVYNWEDHVCPLDQIMEDDYDYDDD